MRINLLPAATLSFSLMGLALSLILWPPAYAQSPPQSSGGVTVVVESQTVKRFTRALQGSLRRLIPRGKIVSCEIVVRSDEPSGQDEIYGGSCFVSTGRPKPIRLLMCDDTMVGKFTLTTQYFWGTPPLDVIGSFVRANCPAGG
jgi:hypothetical protein